MTLMIDLTPEVEARINWNAKRQGVSPTDFVRGLVENAPLPDVSSSETPVETEAGAEEPMRYSFPEKKAKANSHNPYGQDCG